MNIPDKTLKQARELPKRAIDRGGAVEPITHALRVEAQKLRCCVICHHMANDFGEISTQVLVEKNTQESQTLHMIRLFHGHEAERIWEGATDIAKQKSIDQSWPLSSLLTVSGRQRSCLYVGDVSLLSSGPPNNQHKKLHFRSE